MSTEQFPSHYALSPINGDRSTILAPASHLTAAAPIRIDLAAVTAS